MVASEEDEEPTILRRGIDGGKYCVVLRSARRLVESRRVRSASARSSRSCATTRRRRAVDRRRSAAGHRAGRRGLHPLRLVDGVRAHHRQRRGHVRARPVHRLVRAREAQTAHSRRRPAIRSTRRNRLSFPDGYRRYLDWAHANGYSSRYIGSMVADVHRTLLKGGVFLYPPTTTESTRASCG